MNIYYYLSEAKSVCSDQGATTILTAAECRSAISKIPEATLFNKEESDATWPKGCYVTNGHVYWNNHETGFQQFYQYNPARQVCTSKPGV